MKTRDQVPGLRIAAGRMPQTAFGVEPGTGHLARMVRPLTVAAAMSVWPFAVAAQLSTEQVLRDPMRPPAAIGAPATGNNAPPAAPLLQSVMIGPAERWAIIGGERVALGSRYGDARVVGITESEVILRSAAGTRRLRMYPDIVMTQVKPAAEGAKKSPPRKRTDRQ